MPNPRHLTHPEAEHILVALRESFTGPIPRYMPKSFYNADPQTVLDLFRRLELDDRIPTTLFAKLKAKVRSQIWRKDWPSVFGRAPSQKQLERNAALRERRANDKMVRRWRDEYDQYRKSRAMARLRRAAVLFNHYGATPLTEEQREQAEDAVVAECGALLSYVEWLEAETLKISGTER